MEARDQFICQETNIMVTEIKHQTKINQLGVRGRLLIGFATVILVFLIAIIASVSLVVNIQKISTKVITVDLPTFDAFFDLNEYVTRSQLLLLQSLLTNDPRYNAEFESTWLAMNEVETKLDDLSKYWAGDVTESWNEIKNLVGQLKAEQLKTKSAFNSNPGQLNTGNKITLNDPVSRKLVDALSGSVINGVNQENGLYDLLYNNIEATTKSVVNNLHMLELAEYIISAVGILVSILIALITAKSILNHIIIFRKYSSQIASGDLRQHIEIQSSDEMGELGKDFNIMTASLATVTKQITSACQKMVKTLEDAKQAVRTQSSGATEQASSVNEITASLEEIEKSSSQTLEKAQALGDAAERTREKGQQGLEAVEQSIQGMKDIKEKVQLIAQTILDVSNQTQRVGEITAVVNVLAQQSKMLALNASIEAAKAGDAGKGFAIVAAEVKNLAEQSEQSTSQVQKILEDIRHAAEKAVMVTEEGTKGVDYGTILVEQTGEVVRNLRDVIHETTIASQQIEAAIRQESIGIEQITAGMSEINHVTTSFVNSTKKTTEAIDDLTDIAKNLKEHVDTYKV
jgi:methyl-accepting chemotaxis protein